MQQGIQPLENDQKDVVRGACIALIGMALFGFAAIHGNSISTGSWIANAGLVLVCIGTVKWIRNGINVWQL